jgi:hypothetical protein
LEEGCLLAMPIRTLEELSDALSKDLSWRKKELSALRLSISSALGEDRRTCCRSAAVLSYAHWEGFVKCAVPFYLEYVANQLEIIDTFKLEFQVLASWAFFRNLADVTDASPYLDPFRRLQETLKQSMRGRTLSLGKVTDANLSSTKFCRVLSCLSVKRDAFETKFNFIDSVLLCERNEIVHGENVCPDPSDAVLRTNLVGELIEAFGLIIYEEAAHKSFLPQRNFEYVI